MNAEVIGTWAGQVWNALNESGKLTAVSYTHLTLPTILRV